jgi:hypothetical protein
VLPGVELLRTLEAHNNAIFSLAFEPKGRRGMADFSLADFSLAIRRSF